MSISRKDIKKIATLARLKLTPDEEIRYAEQLSSVLLYVDMLNEVDTTGVRETYQVNHLSDVVREDVVRGVSVEQRTDLVKSFPQVERDMLVVPPVFEDTSEL